MSQRATPMAHLGAQEQSVGGSGAEADKDAGAGPFGGAHTLGFEFLHQRRVPVPDGPVYTGTCMCVYVYMWRCVRGRVHACIVYQRCAYLSRSVWMLRCEWRLDDRLSKGLRGMEGTKATVLAQAYHHISVFFLAVLSSFAAGTE
jgi:hypothetical protein